MQELKFLEIGEHKSVGKESLGRVWTSSGLYRMGE